MCGRVRFARGCFAALQCALTPTALTPSPSAPRVSAQPHARRGRACDGRCVDSAAGVGSQAHVAGSAARRDLRLRRRRRLPLLQGFPCRPRPHDQDPLVGQVRVKAHGRAHCTGTIYPRKCCVFRAPPRVLVWNTACCLLPPPLLLAGGAQPHRNRQCCGHVTVPNTHSLSSAPAAFSASHAVPASDMRARSGAPPLPCASSCAGIPRGTQWDVPLVRPVAGRHT